MLQTGIFTGYFPYPLEEVASRIRALGFNTVQLDVGFKDMELGPGQLTAAKCKKIRETFRRYNLPVCCLSGYTNLVHPDPARRKANVDRIKEIIRFAHELGSPYVISETGTFDPDSDWVPHPKNTTEEGYEICRDVIADIVAEARRHDVIFMVETYVYNVIGTVERTLRLFADISDPCLKLLMDPTNYYDDKNILEMDRTLNAIFDALSEHTLIAHAKDVKLTDEGGVRMAGLDATEAHNFRGVGRVELPAAGLGQLNYDLFLQRLSRRHPNIPIIIEHLDEADIPRAKAFLDQKLNENKC